MLKQLAKFRLRHSWPLAPAPQQIVPANDNRPAGRLPRRRPNSSKRLVCRWSPIEARTELGCRWEIEDIADQPASAPDEGCWGGPFTRLSLNRLIKKRLPGRPGAPPAPGPTALDCSNESIVLRQQHSTVSFGQPFGAPPSNREWHAITLSE